MSIVPVLVVDPIEYGPPSSRPLALLDVACVGGRVRDAWGQWLHAISIVDPIEVTTSTGEPGGARSLSELVSHPLSVFDPFDTVLFVNVRLLPLKPDGLLGLREAARAEQRTVVHLLADADGTDGHLELVYAPTEGAVHGIQRYLEPTVTAQGGTLGVIASLVPVRSLLALGAGTGPQAVSVSPVNSLATLRSALVFRGVASTDRTDSGPHFDLATEEGALSFIQQRTRAAHAMQGGADSAQRRGAVVVEAGAVVPDDVLVVGPSYIAAGAHVGAGARIAQSVLLDGAEVAAGATVRHCIVSGDRPSDAVPLRRQRSVSAAFGEPVTPRRSLYLRVRPVVESVLAGIALVLLSPLLLLLSLVVKLTSAGPIFYRDRREGLGARPFDCLKFRTMRVNAHEMQRQLKAQQYADGPHFKMTNDPRLTPVGGLLRRLNLDELPQILNVWRGEMSFVGPRPSPLSENQICAPWRKARLAVTPGITGLWQVCRRDRTSGDFHQWIEFDLLYTEHVSFLVDLRILWATVRTRGGQWPVPVASIIGDSGDEAASRLALFEAALSSTQIALDDAVVTQSASPRGEFWESRSGAWRLAEHVP
jgi:lipopolysaccharide/colanic/teichoic acid biosynthesis glycosyltransferase